MMTKKVDYAPYFKAQCARITMPMTHPDDIRSAANILRSLCDHLDEIAASQSRQTLKILEARMLISMASADLKGGTKFKGRTT